MKANVKHPVRVKNIKCSWYYTFNRMNTQFILLIPRRKDEEVTVILQNGEKLLFPPQIDMMGNIKTHKYWVAVRMWTWNADFPYEGDMAKYCLSLVKNIIIHCKYDEEEIVYCSNLV